MLETEHSVEHDDAMHALSLLCEDDDEGGTTSTYEVPVPVVHAVREVAQAAKPQVSPPLSASDCVLWSGPRVSQGEVVSLETHPPAHSMGGTCRAVLAWHSSPDGPGTHRYAVLGPGFIPVWSRRTLAVMALAHHARRRSSALEAAACCMTILKTRPSKDGGCEYVTIDTNDVGSVSWQEYRVLDAMLVCIRLTLAKVTRRGCSPQDFTVLAGLVANGWRAVPPDSWEGVDPPSVPLGLTDQLRITYNPAGLERWALMPEACGKGSGLEAGPWDFATAMANCTPGAEPTWW